MTVQSTAPAASPSGIARYVADYHALSELMAVAIETDFVPAHFRPAAFLPKNTNPDRATAEQWQRARQTAIASATIGARFGVGLGLGGVDDDPFVALSNVYVVSGKPGLYAESMVALVQDRGHDVWTEDITDARAVVCGRRKGTDHVERVTITMQQAKTAGWTRNAKYQNEPQSMLYARAAARVCRRIAADALKGFGRSAEELEDDAVIDAGGTANGTRRVQRAPQPAAVTAAPQPAPVATAGPPLPGETVAAPDGRDEPAQPIDERDWRRINARFVDLNVTGAGQTAQRLQVISAIVGRPITRGGELTAEEAAVILDNLAGDAGARVIAAALGDDKPAAASPEPSAGPPLPGEDDDEHDQDDADDDADDLEPAADDGPPAVLERTDDPWAGQ